MQNITLDEIKHLVRLQLGVKNVRDGDRFAEELGAESADLANLVALVEERYRIEIKESEIGRIRTPVDLFQAVQSHLEGKG